MSEEGFYKYLRSIGGERCESVPELSGSHVPVLRAPLKCRLRVYQLSPVRSRAPGRGRLDRYRRSGKLLLMSVLFCNGGLMSLSSDVWGKNAHLRKESIFRTKHQSDTLSAFFSTMIRFLSKCDYARQFEVHETSLFSPEIQPDSDALSLFYSTRHWRVCENSALKFYRVDKG